MAQKYIAITTSDLSGVDLADGDGDTIAFTVGRRSYLIDLTNDEVGAFYDALQPYIDVARHADGPTTTTRARRSTAPKQDVSTIRAWANANGHPVNARGRIPAAVLSAYEAAQ